VDNAQFNDSVGYLVKWPDAAAVSDHAWSEARVTDLGLKQTQVEEILEISVRLRSSSNMTLQVTCFATPRPPPKPHQK
jgi:hypothetical protein